MTGDQDLWQAVQQGKEQAYRQLFDRYWEMVYVMAFRYLKDGDASRDIVHNIFLTLWQRREFLEIRTFEAYLKSACRYHVYKHLKTRHHSALTFVEEDDLKYLSKDTIINHAEYDERYNEMLTLKDYLLKTLPKRCQEIFSLSREEQLSNQEISDKLNISKRTVENQLTHALKHLRLGLKKFLCL